MFDPVSRDLLRQAPDLPGLDPEELDELLTEAQIELATIRLEEGGDQPVRSIEVMARVRRLASTFEAYVALDLQPDKTRAAAFVAGSAHQILSRLRMNRERPTLASSDALGSAISATLLFLIADRAADAAEMAAQLRARGEGRAVRRSLILSLRELATTNLSALLERDLDEDFIDEEDSREMATDLLFRECAKAVQALAAEARGQGALDDEVVTRLSKVIKLSEASSDEVKFGIDRMVHYQFAGPHHLATLLMLLVNGVRNAMLVRLPAPSGADVKAWGEWANVQAISRPFLWVNHLKAIQTGYLNRGRSLVMTSPTGSGKTTLSVLKIAATLCGGESVVYLAPTHALVDQVEEDLTQQLGSLESVVIVEDTALEELGERLPPFSVMTPERCLALLGAAPKLFDKVGLLVFDEFHLISADDPAAASKVSTRAVDAMLALLTFMRYRSTADILLLSAMVADGQGIARWLRVVTGREADAFEDAWKPTRQLRTCVIYDNQDVADAALVAMKEVTKKARDRIPARPLGLFSLISGWHPKRPEKLLIRALTDRRPALTRNAQGQPTSNRNEVAAQIAVDYAAAGKRVIVFCSDTRGCGSVADQVNELLTPANVEFDPTQADLRASILADVGSKEAAFDPSDCRAAVHHGDLLPLERRLVESVFRVRREFGTGALGLDVLAATSTIAQGLNLPCDVVVLAGTDRSAADDPNGNPREDLRPHEILNAMGRAGRAAYAATGVAIVVPAQPIRVDTGNFVPPDREVLKIIFSEQDACEQIYDPIEQLLDRIEVDADIDPRAQALIRRLTAVTDAGGSGFDDIVGRSLGFFRKREIHPQGADTWLQSRQAALKAAESSFKDPPVLDWQREIAVRNGVPPAFIERLVLAITDAPLDAAATADWLKWLLGVVAQEPLELTIFVRETALESVFGRAYTNSEDYQTTNALIIGALKVLVEMWCSGSTLVDIEAWILLFVRKNEGAVKKQAPSSSKVQRARRFAIRIAPDLGFLCSILGQVAAHLVSQDELEPIPVIDMLPQMVRSGDRDRHQAVLRQQDSTASRVVTFTEVISMQPNFKAGPNADIEEVRADIATGLALKAFAKLVDDEDL